MRIALIILIAIGLVSGYAYADHRNWLPEKQGIHAPAFVLPTEVSQQFAVLSDRTKELGGHVQNAIGMGIQRDDRGKNMQERAIEYGQYMYCKQVVEVYEQDHPPAAE